MYADDSTVSVLANTAEELNTVLNFELQSVVEWTEKNRFFLNVSKTNLFLVQTAQCLIPDQC